MHSTHGWKKRSNRIFSKLTCSFFLGSYNLWDSLSRTCSGPANHRAQYSIWRFLQSHDLFANTQYCLLDEPSFSQWWIRHSPATEVSLKSDAIREPIQIARTMTSNPSGRSRPPNRRSPNRIPPARRRTRGPASPERCLPASMCNAHHSINWI